MRARVMGSYLNNRDVTVASDQPLPRRRKGRLLCGAKTRAGGCCQVRAEPGKARSASMVANRQVRRRRLVVRVSPRFSAGAGTPIERGFGRSEVTTRPDPKGKYPSAVMPRYIVTPSRVAARDAALLTLMATCCPAKEFGPIYSFRS